MTTKIKVFYGCAIKHATSKHFTVIGPLETKRDKIAEVCDALQPKGLTVYHVAKIEVEVDE